MGGSPTIIRSTITANLTVDEEATERQIRGREEREKTPHCTRCPGQERRYPQRWTRTECRRHQPGYLYTHNKEEGILRGLLIWNPYHMHGKRASRNEDSLTAATPTLSSPPLSLLAQVCCVLQARRCHKGPLRYVSLTESWIIYGA